ncbi:MAG: hypothetical protein F6K11_10135 [Leptolyngbya sp. SIO3F4]|nr:hypothetical protein [Leptolyngbya sp. SIO3F4]
MEHRALIYKITYNGATNLSQPTPGQKELWKNARVFERDDVKQVTEKFIEANKYPEK